MKRTYVNEMFLKQPLTNHCSDKRLINYPQLNLKSKSALLRKTFNGCWYKWHCKLVTG